MWEMNGDGKCGGMVWSGGATEVSELGKEVVQADLENLFASFRGPFNFSFCSILDILQLSLSKFRLP